MEQVDFFFVFFYRDCYFNLLDDKHELFSLLKMYSYNSEALFLNWTENGVLNFGNKSYLQHGRNIFFHLLGNFPVFKVFWLV